MYETWMDFNNSLISTGIFDCSLCKNILIPPVFLSAQCGNVCNICYQNSRGDLNMNNCIENKSLSIILEKLYFPCRYKEKGCTEKLQLLCLNPHEKDCCFRTMPCVFSSRCLWDGRKLDMVKHFLEIHKDVTLQSEDDKFDIDTSIVEESDKMNLLETSLGLFLIRIKVSPANRKMYIKIYDHDEKLVKYEFKIKIESKQNQVCYKTVLKVSHEIEIMSDFKMDEVTEVDLANLQQSLRTGDQKIIRNIIKVTCKDDDIIMENTMLNHLNCPECNQLLRPPIYQCITGHTICAACKIKVIKCPICEENYGSTRNYTLESLANKIRYPCQFESNGCKIKALPSSNHEATCDYQSYSCFMKKCHFKATHVGLMDHLRKEHQTFCFDSEETVHFTKSLNKKNESSVIRISVINYNIIFKMTNGHDSTHVHWGVNMISPHNDRSTFIYEITIYSPNETEKKLIRRGIMTNKQVCIFSVNRDDIKDFLIGETLSYYFRVIKNNSHKLSDSQKHVRDDIS